jgi:uncharacterized protein (TIGR03437 family)
MPAGTGNIFATADPVTGKYPASLPVVTGGSASTNTFVKVAFAPIGTGSTLYAPISFATPTQINAIVPSGVTLGAMKVVVSYGASTAAASDAFPVTIVSAAPGLFTLAATGQGQGAIVNNTAVATLNGAIGQGSAPASTGSNTVISLYASGLGIPLSTGALTGAPGTVYPTNCISTKTYMTAAGYTGNTATLDGAILKYSLFSGFLPPCLLTDNKSAQEVTVIFGCGQAGPAPVIVNGTNFSYAGFTADQVAGLYQINVQVPSNLNVTAACPISIQVGSASVTSQPGVTVNIGN